MTVPPPPGMSQVSEFARPPTAPRPGAARSRSLVIEPKRADRDRARTALLLLLNGLVLATHTMLARQAGQGGASPVLYAFASAAGAAAFLAVFRALRQPGSALAAPVYVFGAIAGLVSIAVPQVLIYSASAYVSAGVASLAYAFPTPLTYVLARLAGLERASTGRTIGIAIAFCGALMLAFSRSPVSGEGFWIILAMLAPIFIAGGNIYRAKFWPEGSTPLDLALAMSAGAALWLGLLALVSGGIAQLSFVAASGWLILLAVPALAAFGNLIYFELQKAGGIVSFSQIGYAGAVLGLFGGYLVLGESYSLWIWMAALVIAAGIVVSEMFRAR
jgi:drug/metabolite transporter (DMT)-like permease